MQRKDQFAPENFYHIYNRGIDKRIILKSQHDYQRFVMLLYIANSKENIHLTDFLKRGNKNIKEIFEIKIKEPLVSIGAWCLMSNHFHIVLREEVDGGISKFMKKLGTGYAMYFNIKYKRAGNLFGGPFKSKLIVEDDYLKYLFGYIHLNPLEIEFSDWKEQIDKGLHEDQQNFLKKYEYSSYQDYLGVERKEGGIINKKPFPDYFRKENSFEDFVKDYILFNQDK